MTTPQQEAEQVVIALTEDCFHGLGRPKVDCPECCEAVLAEALLAAEQRGRAQEREQAAHLADTHCTCLKGVSRCRWCLLADAIRRGGADA